MGRFLRNLLVRVLFHVLLALLVYLSNDDGDLLKNVVVKKLETVVKGEAGKMLKAKVIGAPSIFLHKRFPSWNINHNTYMIPSSLMARCNNVLGNDEGDSIIFNLLKQLGELNNMGMFVVQGFQLNKIKKLCKSRVLPKIRGSDFIVFHHTLGVIALEVKDKIDSATILDAEDELKISHNIITILATYEKSENFNIPRKKVIAMPHTKKSDFNREEFPMLEEDTLLLFEEDSRNITSFYEWWQVKLEKPTSLQPYMLSQGAYEQALSYTLMIRHLGPETEDNFLFHFRESLVSNKYALHQEIQKQFPNFWFWIWEVLGKKNRPFDFEGAKVEELKEGFAKRHHVSVQDLTSEIGMSIIDSILGTENKYISGQTVSMIDYALAIAFEDTRIFMFRHILNFIKEMRHSHYSHVEERKAEERLSILKEYPFLQLQTLEDLQQLNDHFSRFSFIEGDTLTELDQELFKTLTCQTRVKHSRLPMVMNSEQLDIFEGPMKQLIIGPPGSGKTELMKFKALELELMMKICKEEKKILYIVANGSPDYSNTDSLFFYHIREFFKKSTLVEVISIILEEESKEALAQTNADLREKMTSGMYDHAFVDEYWIGSKRSEHQIMKELVAKMSGYVWISSVHEYSESDKHRVKISDRTEPLITEIKENGGVVNRITQVLRATNAIIDVERGYSNEYRHRSYPFGTKRILGHSFEGLPVSWFAEKNLDDMYIKCVDTVESALGMSTNIFHGEKLSLDPDDILVVNFAIRTVESLHVEQSLNERFNGSKIPIWTFGDSMENFTKCGVGKVSLMESLIREASCYFDGVEWPMVIIILPSNLLLNKAVLASGAQKLRNYDPYISFFRAMVKLVIISDKWTKKEDFLADIAIK